MFSLIEYKQYNHDTAATLRVDRLAFTAACKSHSLAFTLAAYINPPWSYVVFLLLLLLHLLRSPPPLHHYALVRTRFPLHPFPLSRVSFPVCMACSSPAILFPFRPVDSALFSLSFVFSLVYAPSPPTVPRPSNSSPRATSRCFCAWSNTHRYSIVCNLSDVSPGAP